MRPYLKPVLLALLATSAFGDDYEVCKLGELTPTGTTNMEQLASPLPHQAWADWRNVMTTWRSSCLTTIDHDSAVYESEALRWTQTSYMQPQMHPFDLYAFDQEKQVYTVGKFLDFLDTLYGGADSVLLWPTYPNIGLDDRNQFDLIRAMPGGVDALSDAIGEFHARGIKVLYPYNPWDSGTRRSAQDDAHEMASLLNETGADGFNGDTMNWVSDEFFTASGNTAAIEPEGAGSGNVSSINWSTMGWGYWTYPLAPLVDSLKWLEPRHLTHVCNRWAQNHTDDLQAAWANGVGFETWQNVWGTYNGLTPRDAEAIRRVATMLRFFGGRGYLQSPTWQPHAPVAAQDAVFAATFPSPAKTGFTANSSLYSLVNRVDRDVQGTQVVLPGSEVAGRRFIDAFHGHELKPATVEYTRLGIGTNCFAGHGATDLEPTPGASHGALQLPACAAACDSTPGCDAVVVGRRGGCYRRKDVVPAACTLDNDFDTYVKRLKPKEVSVPAGFRLLGSTMNCFARSGATDLESPEGAAHAMGVGVAECAKACGAGCTGVVFSPSTGACYRRAHLSPAACQTTADAAGFSTYLKDDGTATLDFEIEALGYGALLVLGEGAAAVADDDDELAAYLKTMAELSAQKLASFTDVWEYLPQTREANPPSKARAPPGAPPAGMVSIPATTNFTFNSSGVEIEGDDAHGVDLQYPGEAHPGRSHLFSVNVPAFHMDKYPVTNAEYAAFVAKTKYAPADSVNWLKHWNISADGTTRTVPAGSSNQPVTYVALSDAQAYCRAQKKRLPSDEEFLYAAQGLDGRPFPWGPEDDFTGHFRPKLVQTNDAPGPEDVGAHSPQGDSPFGVSDMVGNVWQYASVFRDEHTRAAVLRGSSNYRPDGSLWYLPEARSVNTHEKYFLMGPSYERAATLGFRCVMDAGT